MTAAEAYADAPMDKADIEHLFSMVWPDVRLKRYVEIRQGDSVPFDVALGYAALIKGIFYGETNLDIIEHALGVGEARHLALHRAERRGCHRCRDYR